MRPAGPGPRGRRVGSAHGAHGDHCGRDAGVAPDRARRRPGPISRIVSAGPTGRIAIDIDSTLHHHWPLVAAAAKRRFGVELPYEQQFPWARHRLSEEQLRACIDDTHSDEAIAGARPYAHAVESVN